MYCHQLLAFAFSLLPLVGTASSACFWPRFFCCLLATASSLQSAFTAAALDAIRIRFRLHLPQQLLMHLHPLFSACHQRSSAFNAISICLYTCQRLWHAIDAPFCWHD
jgi:hypothetical protein